MKIKITIEDIRKAKEETRKFKEKEIWHYSRAETCPLAFALRRVYAQLVVRVLPHRIFIGERFIDLSPGEVMDFIVETDRKKDRIRPRELEIDLDAPTTTTT